MPFKYCVAASSLPSKIFFASEKVMPFTAPTKMGVDSLTASSAARFKTSKPWSAKLDKPMLRKPLSTFCNSSGNKILTKSFLKKPSF